MVPTDWTPAGFTGIARREACGRFVLDPARGTARRPSSIPAATAEVDHERLACVRRVMAHTLAHFRRTGWNSATRSDAAGSESTSA